MLGEGHHHGGHAAADALPAPAPACRPGVNPAAREHLQGYLAHKKQRPPRTLQGRDNTYSGTSFIRSNALLGPYRGGTTPWGACSGRCSPSARNSLPARYAPPLIVRVDRLRVGWLNGGRGTTRAEDAQGKPTQSHISPSIPVYEDYPVRFQHTKINTLCRLSIVRLVRLSCMSGLKAEAQLESRNRIVSNRILLRARESECV